LPCPTGDQFLAHVTALPGNPYDGHTLAAVVPAIEQQIGVSLNASSPTKDIADTMRRPLDAAASTVYISGQMCGVTAVIRRELRRRAAVEPVAAFYAPRGYRRRHRRRGK
jgi:IS5 family transposase